MKMALGTAPCREGAVGQLAHCTHVRAPSMAVLAAGETLRPASCWGHSDNQSPSSSVGGSKCRKKEERSGASQQPGPDAVDQARMYTGLRWTRPGAQPHAGKGLWGKWHVVPLYVPAAESMAFFCRRPDVACILLGKILPCPGWLPGRPAPEEAAPCIPGRLPCERDAHRPRTAAAGCACTEGACITVLCRPWTSCGCTCPEGGRGCVMGTQPERNGPRPLTLLLCCPQCPHVTCCRLPSPRLHTAASGSAASTATALPPPEWARGRPRPCWGPGWSHFGSARPGGSPARAQGHSQRRRNRWPAGSATVTAGRTGLAGVRLKRVVVGLDGSALSPGSWCRAGQPAGGALAAVPARACWAAEATAGCGLAARGMAQACTLLLSRPRQAATCKQLLLIIPTHATDQPVWSAGGLLSEHTAHPVCAVQA